MKHRCSLIGIAFLAWFLVAPIAPAQTPLGDSFTYQGGLKEDGVPATGSYDFQFSLFAMPSGGTPLAGPVAASNVPVANGLFTIDIDFSMNLFDGDSYWLETAVQPSGGGPFTTLAPRVELTAAPNAHFARLAGDADTVDGAHASDLFNQTLVLNGTDLELTDGNGTLTVDLSSLGGAGSDDDITAVTFAGNMLTVAEGATMFSADLSGIAANWNNLTMVPAGFADNTDDTADADADPTNELQNIEEVLIDGSDANGQGVENLGSVGIGTATPMAPLDIANTGDGAPLLRFSTERQWIFRQEGTGAASALLLQSEGADKAFTIRGLDGDVAAQFFATDLADAIGSRVGIGTAVSSNTLEVGGDARVQGAFRDSANSPGTDGQILSSAGTGTQTAWIDPPSGGGDNLGNHTATATLNMAGNDINMVAGTLNLNTGNLNTNGGTLVDFADNVIDILASARVTGAFRDSSNDPGTAGQVLSSTVTGTNWIDAPGGGGGNPSWELAGNAGTTPGTDFLGTTDAQALEIHVDSAGAGGRVWRVEPAIDADSGVGDDTFSPNIIGGVSDNLVAAGVAGAVIAGGGDSSFFGTPFPNRIFDEYGFIGGGFGNTAGNDDSDTTTQRWATVGGGGVNTASGDSATVAGGQQNTASDSGATVGGGIGNMASGFVATVGGGLNNTVSAQNATVAGGNNNMASDSGATVAGGSGNVASGNAATVGGGELNAARGTNATIGGGLSNQAPTVSVTSALRNNYLTIGGGQANAIGGTVNNSVNHATIAGGNTNRIFDPHGFIGGGQDNVAGTDDAIANAAHATVSGGSSNTASGNAATVPGGSSNTASGDNSFAAGQNATISATGDNSFLWSDGTAVTEAAANAFHVEASGRVVFSNNGGAGLNAGAGFDQAVFINSATGELHRGAVPGGTDSQTLSFASPNLSITGGNMVSLAALSDNLGDHTATTDLDMAGNAIDSAGGLDLDGALEDQAGSTGADGDVLTKVSGQVQWAPAGAGSAQNLAQVLTTGNDAGGLDAVNFGNVGVGTASPAVPLHVVGPPVAGPISPALLGTALDAPFGTFNNLGGPRDVFVSGSTAYVVTSNDTDGNGLTIIDVSNPGSPALLGTALDGDGTFDNLLSPQGLFVSGSTAYIVAADDTDGNGLTIIDVSTPGSPMLLGTATGAGFGFGLDDLPGDVFVSGSIAYVTKFNVLGGPGGLSIIDVSVPGSPMLLATVLDGVGGFMNLLEPRSVFVSGSTAYVAAQDGTDGPGLTIINVSNPATPMLESVIIDGVGGFNNLGGPRSVFVSGSTAYVAALDVPSGLTIIDVTNPASPALLGTAIDGDGTFDTLDDPLSVFVSGSTAYVGANDASNGRGLTIIDVSDPMNPALLGTAIDGTGDFMNLQLPRSVFVSGSTAYVAVSDANGSGLSIIDVGPAGGDGLRVDGAAQMERLRVDGAALVEQLGVGTLAPQSPLHVARTGGAGANLENGVHLSGGDGGGNANMHLVGGTPFIDFLNDNTDDFDARFILTGDDVLDLQGARLFIANTQNNDVTNFGFLNQAGGTGNFAGTQNVPVSLTAAGRVVATEFAAFSDERVKNVIGRSDARADLDTLLSIEVTDYTMKDTVNHDARPRKKALAQQVEEVYPAAVSLTSGVVPDIYRMARAEAGGWVRFEEAPAEPLDLKAGQTVRLLTDEGASLHEIVEVSREGFRVAARLSGMVFVYGRQVDDFHTVDYEAIAMLNVSATQALHGKLLEKDAQIEALRAENAAQEARLREQEERLARLEALLLGDSRE